LGATANAGQAALDPDVAWDPQLLELAPIRAAREVHAVEESDVKQCFEDHVALLRDRRILAFTQMLESDPHLSLTASWESVASRYADDPRLQRLTAACVPAAASTDAEAREHVFGDFMRNALRRSREDVQALFRETKFITYETKVKLNEPVEGDVLQRAIHHALELDRRWHVLACLGPVREEMLSAYIDELARKGPPPPPTSLAKRARGEEDDL
jgi:transcription elongation regulator 1